MAKLSHIDDFSDNDLDAAMKKAAAQTRKNLDEKSAQDASGKRSASSAQNAPRQSVSRQGASNNEVNRNKAEKIKDASSSDEDDVPMKAGQKLITALAFVVLAAVILYILNYWFHFV